MASFPNSVYSAVNPTSTSPRNSPSLAGEVTGENTEIEAIETLLLSGANNTFLTFAGGLPVYNALTFSSPGGSVGSPGSTVTIAGTPFAPTFNVTRRDEFYLSDYGIHGDFGTDNGNNFYNVLNALVVANGAVSAVLPRGTVVSSNGFTIPTMTKLTGQGWFYYGTNLQLTGATACDAVTFQVWDGTHPNAFFCTLRDVFVNANNAGLGNVPGSWHSGINITNVPFNAYQGSSPADPNFDPQHRIERVRVQAATGEGIYTHSHGAQVWENIWMYYNQGDGAIPPFDSTIQSGNFQENGLAGLFVPWTDTMISGCHFYNNGTTPWFASVFVGGSGTSWTLSKTVEVGNGTQTITVPAGTTAPYAYNASGSTIAAAILAIPGFTGTCTGTGSLTQTGLVTLTFSVSQASLAVTLQQNFYAGQHVYFAGAVYCAATALSAYAGNPYTDTTNWLAPARPHWVATGATIRGPGGVNDARSWGWGLYLFAGGNSNVGTSWTNENASGGVCLDSTTGNIISINITSVNCVPQTGAAFPTNPNNWAGLMLTNAYNNMCNCTVSGNSPWNYVLKIAAGAANNVVSIVTDNSCQVLSSDTPQSALLANTIFVNGKQLLPTAAISIANGGALLTTGGTTGNPTVVIAGVTAAAVGDLVIMASRWTPNGGPVINSVTGGPVDFWTTGPVVNGGGAVSGEQMFLGIVTTLTPTAVTINYSSTIGGQAVGFMEIAKASGVWSRDGNGGVNGSPGALPSLTPTNIGEAYIGFVGTWGAYISGAGSTPGYTYLPFGSYATDGAFVYNLNVSAGPQAPTIAVTNNSNAVAQLIVASGSAL